MPIPQCYGPMALAPEDSQSYLAALSGPFCAAERNTLPLTWQNGLQFFLDHALPSSGHHPRAVAAVGNSPLIGGWRDVPTSVPGLPSYLPQPVAWFGVTGRERDISASAVEGVPLIGAAVLAGFAGDLGDGNFDPQMVGYALDSTQTERAALWDFSNGPQNAPALSLLPNGSRALAINNFNIVGYEAAAPDQPKLWVGGQQDINLGLPSPAADHSGGRAVAIGGQFIVGYTVGSDQTTRHAAVWNADGADPRDAHPAGFSSSEMTATAGKYIVGIGLDTNGLAHALLWDGGNLSQPFDLAPLLSEDPIIHTGVPQLTPTAVDEAGNIALSAGEGDFQLGYYLRNQGASLSGLTTIRHTPTNALVTGQVIAGCEPVSVFVAVYLSGALVAMSSTQTVGAGTEPVTLTNLVAGLSPATVYQALMRADGANASFGSTTFIETPSTNLPPTGQTNLVFMPHAPLPIAVSDLLSAVTDPEGDPVSLGDVPFIQATPGGGTLTYNLGDPFFTYTPGPTTTTDRVTIAITDSRGRSGSLLLTLSVYVPPPSLSIALDSTNGTLTLSVSGLPNFSYLLESAASLQGAIDWNGLGPVTTDNNGLSTVSWPVSLHPSAFYRVRSP